MTFLEAAIEVLRREGKPLAVRRLAELALQHNLLSVVGRDPEATMQARLDEVLDKGPTHPELARAGAGLYGLRAYPPRPYPIPREVPEVGAVENGASTADEEHDPELDGDKSVESAAAPGRRRRRRGRGRGPSAAAAGEQAVKGSEGEEVAPSAASPGEAGGADVEEMDEEAAEFEVDADGASSAPLMVATAGDEELTRSGEEREIRSEILGRRDDRGRHRRDARGRGGDRGRDGQRPRPEGQHGAAHAPQPGGQHAPQHDRGSRPQHDRGPVPPREHAGATSAAAPIAHVTGPRSLAADLSDLLRAQDGRPQHARALAQEVERRKILEGRPQPEIVREVRMALHGELSARPARGLRARVRALGGGNYGSTERKLDEELLSAERAFEAALDRLGTATNAAVRRRLTKLSPFSFEQLGRCIAESLGVERPTLVRRGDGVAYFGGERVLGAVRSRVMIAVRSGEAELGRRAVGELRAGLDARGFDEGVLIALGRLSSEAREELRAGRAVTVYDGDSIATLMVERRLGVRVHQAPIAYLDPDFFFELNET